MASSTGRFQMYFFVPCILRDSENEEYAGMFGNLLYQHKKAFRLPIKYIFSMVLYSLFAFQCIHFPTGGIVPRTSVNSPLYVRHPYMQGSLVNLPCSRIRTANVQSWENEVSNLPLSMFIN